MSFAYSCNIHPLLAEKKAKEMSLPSQPRGVPVDGAKFIRHLE